MRLIFPYVVLAAAILISASSAYYSVFGLSKLFSSQSTAIIILAGSLESAKLITATYLHRYWSYISRLMKIYMCTAVIILMFITSLGVYGFLVSAYQTTAYALENLNSSTDALQTKKIRFESQLANLNKSSQTIDKNINTLTIALSNNVIKYTDNSGNQVIKTSAENRNAYEQQLSDLNSRLAKLQTHESQLLDSISIVDTRILQLKTNSKISAEIGPLKYIAQMTGMSVDATVNWLIILLIVVFDPLAIVLLISANFAFNLKLDNKQEQEQNNQPIAEPLINTPTILSYWNKLRQLRNNENKN